MGSVSFSTSLSNIFGSSPRHNRDSENESLKYIPPKPVDTTLKPVEDTKTTKCIFACALTAYVWYGKKIRGLTVTHFDLVINCSISIFQGYK